MKGGRNEYTLKAFTLKSSISLCLSTQHQLNEKKKRRAQISFIVQLRICKSVESRLPAYRLPKGIFKQIAKVQKAVSMAIALVEIPQ